MKIVIAGYNTCCFNKSGGVQVRIKKIYELLSKQNDIEVEFFRPMETDINTVDILHLFMLLPEYYNLVCKAKKRGIKIVLSTIIPLENNYKIDIYRYIINKLPILNVYKMTFKILSCVDALIVETKSEFNFIAKHYGVDKKKMVIIPNGVDRNFYQGTDIYKKIGGYKNYVLHVGRFDDNKNQLNVIKALKGTDIDVVFIGGADNCDLTYISRCKHEASGDAHFHFLGWVDSDSNLLRSAYANAKVFVFPSYKETFGLVLLEAAINGCNIAMSNTLPILDYHVFDDAYLFNPNNVNDIRKKINEAFNSEENKQIKNRIIETFSWNSVISKHIMLYKSLLKES